MLPTLPKFDPAVWGAPPPTRTKARLLGFHGAARTGKDTAVSLLQSMYGGRRVAFADPIKDALAAMLGYSDTQLNGSAKEVVDDRYGVSPRYMMQTLGTEWGRKLVNPDLWLLIAMDRISKALAAGEDVYVSDVRFDNEAAVIREMGGTIIHIHRSGAQAVRPHTSETPLRVKDNDYIIYNNGTLDELLAALIKVKESMQ